MSFKNYREETRGKDWGSVHDPGSGLTADEIKLGCLLRIADATELMAQRYQSLIDERDRYKRMYEDRLIGYTKLLKRIAGLKGHIKRLKK